MSTPAPAPTIDASANKQTGPRTYAGKARSSANATLHGGTSTKLIVAEENKADFDSLLHSLVNDYQPDTPQTQTWVENAALAHWFLWRRQRAYNTIEAAVYLEQPDPSRWTEQELKRLALADRYKTQAERALKRAQTNLDNWKQLNRTESDRAEKKMQQEAAQSLRERRMRLQEQKLELAKTRETNQAFRFAKSTEVDDSRPPKLRCPLLAHSVQHKTTWKRHRSEEHLPSQHKVG